jgi:lipid biosynthesis B12-binding/radical SAM protein
MVSANTAVSPYPLYPLGCSMVAATLQSAGHEVRQFDFLACGQSVRTLVDEIRAFGPDIVGISVRNIDNANYLNERRYLDAVAEIVGAVRSASGAKVVLGGAGFSLMPEAILNAVGGDYGIAGEGEALMVSLVNDAEQGRYPTQRVQGPESRLTKREIPSALYAPDLMDYYLRYGNVGSVQTKRGCTHNCVYCTYPSLEGRAIRPRDPAAVVDDVLRLTDKHGVKFIFFIDSVFNDDEGAYKGLLGEMLRRGISTPWTAFLKPSGLTAQTVTMMRQCGMVAAEIGSDAATDITLLRMGKAFTWTDVVDANALLADHGIGCANFYIFGGPGETQQTVAEGIENIQALDRALHFVYLGVRVLPGSTLASIAIDEGLVGAEDNLLEPTYYFSPDVDRDWAEARLTEAFKGDRRCIFPPDSMDEKLLLLHKFGYSGPIWDLLLQTKRRRPPRPPKAPQ